MNASDLEREASSKESIECPTRCAAKETMLGWWASAGLALELACGFYAPMSAFATIVDAYTVEWLGIGEIRGRGGSVEVNSK